MAGERGTAGSPAGSNEMIDVKKARVLYRVCATSLAKFGKFGKFVSRPLAADRQRSRVVPWQRVCRSERYLRAFARSGGALSSRSGSRLGR